MKGSYIVRQIGRDDARLFLNNHHYLSQLGHGFLSVAIFGCFNSDNQIVGVAVYNTISAPETLVGAFGLDRNSDQSRFLELTRLSMDDSLKEKNLTSWFVSRTLRMIKALLNPRAIISYADSDYHVGYIYQATNWKYYGLTDKKKDFWIDGKIQQRGEVKGKTGEWRDRARKHRYAIVYDKSLVVKWKQMEYPKGENKEMPLVHKGAQQDWLF